MIEDKGVRNEREVPKPGVRWGVPRSKRILIVGGIALAVMLIAGGAVVAFRGAGRPEPRSYTTYPSFSSQCGRWNGWLTWSDTMNFNSKGTIYDACSDGYHVKLQMQLDRHWTIGDSQWFNVYNGYCRTYGGYGSSYSTCPQGNPWWNGAKSHGLRLRICQIKSLAPDVCGGSYYYNNPYY